MLKFIFSALLCANAALLAYRLGWLESVIPSGHEPARMLRQQNADRIHPIPPDSPLATQAAAPVSESAPPENIVCLEAGNFTQDEARRFETGLAPLELGTRVSQHAVREIASHMVYIPPQADRDAAEKKAGELRRLGIRDFYIIQDNSPFRWAISLGVFKSEDMARSFLESLGQKGVRTARIGARTVASSLIAFELRNLDAATKSKLDAVMSGFPRQEIRNCAA